MAAHDNSLDHVTFKDVAWIQTFGLNHFNALDYFSTSQFYDRTCNNEQLKMQTKFNNLEEMNMELARMVGTEYALVHFQEPVLYVIRKQMRFDQNSVVPVESYYIIEGSIFKAPSVYNVLTARMVNCLHRLGKVLECTQKNSGFDPSSQYHWLQPVKADGEVQDAGDRAVDSAAALYLKFEHILVDLEKQTASLGQ